MNEKTIQCLPNPSQHIPIYLEQFPSYSNRKCKKLPFSRTAAHIFVSPGDAPEAITLNVVWMKREFHAYKLSSACTHLSSTVSQLFEPQVQKIAIFTYRSPHFYFSWRRPCDYQAICCMDGKTINACQTPYSMYLSIFNSFQVIRWLSQCVSPKIVIFTTFLFSLGTPLGQSR